VTVQRFRLRFRDLGRRMTRLDIGLLAPTRDPNRLLLVLRERLEKVSLAEPVQELFLEARRFEPASAAQDDLSRAATHWRKASTPCRSAWSPGLARMPCADWPPHRTIVRTGPGRQQPGRRAGRIRRARVLLPQARTVPLPRLLGPPERIECGWWEGRQESRDYHLAQDPSGRKLWVYREPGDPQWRLHGLWE